MFHHRRSSTLAPIGLLVAVVVLSTYPTLIDAQVPRPTDPGSGSRVSHVAGEVLLRVRSDARPHRQAIAARVSGWIAESSESLGFDRVQLSDGRSVEDAVQELRSDRRVQWAEPNYRYHAFDLSCCPQDPDLRDEEGVAETQWGAFLTGLPTLWRTQGCSDSLITLAIVDSGIDSLPEPHPDLAGNVLDGGYDFVDGDAFPIDEGQNKGHGTHVAGIAAAAANEIGIVGTAPNARLLIVRVLDCRDPEGCVGTAADIALGIEYAVDLGARVVNLSLGASVPSEAIRSAVYYALENQVTVVAASGNDGIPFVSYPAAIPEVIAVGATNANDEVASFSNWGDELDVVAPGEDIWSTVPGGGWELKSGTSMAAPFISGVAAILASRSPTLRPFEIQSWLRRHTVDLFGFEDGHGRVDFGALEDWSDAGGAYVSAHHGSHFWEWLGSDVSAEEAEDDGNDMDGRPNVGLAAHDSDGADDGMFPGSFAHLPLLPPHLEPEDTELEIQLSVGDAGGLRYGPEYARSLHLDAWFDWNGDETFDTDDSEHEIVDHAEDPSTWTSNRKTIAIGIEPPDEHFEGNPLMVRTRLAYGESAETPGGEAAYGEVEDVSFINFVEDFDLSLQTEDPGTFMEPFGWFFTPDPNPDNGCMNHGEWEMASVPHPNPINIPCNGFVESARGMHTPLMDWSEYTHAKLRFFYCHEAEPCSPHPDLCRVLIDTCGVITEATPIPTGSGVLEVDLSDYAGCAAVQLLFIEETDWAGRLSVDDVIIWAWDESRPAAISDLLAEGIQGPGEALLTWTSPSENTGAPSSDPQSSHVQIRYDTEPIVDDTDWQTAVPARPQDVVAEAGLPIPGAPGQGRSVSIRMPSSFGTYHYAARVGDEVVNLSALSNGEGVDLDPFLDLWIMGPNDTTAAPGENVVLDFHVENTGDLEDLYRVEATSALGWALALEHDYVTLQPDEFLATTVTVTVPGDAEATDVDEVRLIGTSVAGGSASVEDPVLIDVTGGVSGLEDTAGTVDPYVRVLENPFNERISLELGTNRPGTAFVDVHDVSGRLVRRLWNQHLEPGRHRIAWDGTTADGRDAPAGLYWFRVKLPGILADRRILRVK